MRFILRVWLILILLSCEYKAPYSGVVPISLDEELLEWNADDGIIIRKNESAGEFFEYSLELVNILSDESSKFQGGTTGEWLPSLELEGVRRSPSVFEVTSDSDDSNRNILHIELKREPFVEYIYYPLIVDQAQSNYIFRYDYIENSKLPVDFYLSIGTDTDSDYKVFRRVVAQRERATAIESLSFIEPGEYHIRFGNADIEYVIPTFSLYFYNAYIFKNSNHAVSQTVKISQPGIYRVGVSAKSETSDRLTLKISGYAGTFLLTGEYSVYSYYIRLDAGVTTIEIMPVDSVLSERIPGRITVSSPFLEFHPDRSSID